MEVKFFCKEFLQISLVLFVVQKDCHAVKVYWEQTRKFIKTQRNSLIN